MKKPNYRLSTDEVERLVKEETERRRKLRIVQVREQAKANAALIRDKVRSEKDRLLKQFADEVKNELVAEKAEKVRKLEQKYDNTLRTVGQGHREVHVQGDGQNIAAQKNREQQANRNVAEERFKAAVKKHDRDKTMQEWDETRHIRNRNVALEVEKERAAAIASLPPPPSDISTEMEKIQKKAIPMTDMKAFATTHYHIPDFQVVKAGPEEQMYDAKELAQESDLRLKQDQAEKKRSHHEQTERARIRGNEALQREMLKHDLGDMLQDLSLLQRKDRRRRQALVADVPKQVFIPPERCMEERADCEIEMERKFEDIYLKQQKSDSSSTQVWSELPMSAQELTEMSTASLESVPVTAVPMVKGINPALRDVTNFAKPTSGKQPDTVLKQLLAKIKEQRNNATSSHHRLPVSVAVSANDKPVGECDAQSVMSAESRASWRKTVGDEERSAEFRESNDRDEIDVAKESSSGLDGVTLSKTSNMIEELQERIRMIEGQKLQLSEQLQSQTDFYKKFQQLQQKKPNSHEPTPDMKDNDCNSSLSEVSLTSSQKLRFNIPDARSSKRSPMNQSQFSVVSDCENTSVDLSSVMSNLRPVFGILKGPKNPSYELLTSNGFLPLPDMSQVRLDEKVAADSSNLEALTNKNGEGLGIDLEQDPSVAKQSDEELGTVSVKGARRMIDFKQMPSGSMVKFGKTKMLDDSQSPEFSHQIESFSFNDLFFPDSTGGSLNQDDQLDKRMKDYQLRAQNIQMNLDEDTLTKVREYQDRLLQTHEERKEFLSNVRADIERRRQALYNTSRFSTGLASHLMNLGMPSSNTHCKTGGDIYGHQEDKKYQTFEPIAPFVADPWISKSGGRMDDGVRFDGLYAAPRVLTCSSKQGDIVGEQEDNLAPRHRVSGNSGLDYIRKSLPFDDLNDSNFDTSAVRDYLNDTATSRSHGPCDDSKLLSSEEERGSPILTGSRSSRFDMSDKSNNSVTGSSSLNGSVLVARAEERREGFERRQEELRRQLTEIQGQKEAILQRYYDGQQALLQQQESLKAKLASSVTGSQPDPVLQDFQQIGQLRGKLSLMGSEIEPDTAVVNENEGPQYSSGAQISRQTLDPCKGVYPTSWSAHLKPFQNDSDIDFKLCQTRNSSAEFPTDSYLDDISYHQIKESNDPSTSVTSLQKLTSLSSSEGVSPYTNDTRSKVLKIGVGGNEDGTYSALHTWASVLQATHSSDDKPKSQEHSFGSTCGASESQSSFGIYHQHQPHELSTILEVDTPTASSAHSSNVRPAVSSLSNASVSHSSTLPLISRWDSDVKVDNFVDPPHTFPSSSFAAGMAYDLSSGAELRGPDVGEHKSERSGISLTETSKVARSLHFQQGENEFGAVGQRREDRRFLASDQNQPPRHSPTNISRVSFHNDAITLFTLEGDDMSSLQSRSITLQDDKDVSLESRSLSPDYLDRIHRFREIHVEVKEEGEEELSTTTMPDLVGLTPIKPQLPEESDP